MYRIIFVILLRIKWKVVDKYSPGLEGELGYIRLINFPLEVKWKSKKGAFHNRMEMVDTILCLHSGLDKSTFGGSEWD